jgi:hypothetical protein
MAVKFKFTFRKQIKKRFTFVRSKLKSEKLFRPTISGKALIGIPLLVRPKCYLPFHSIVLHGIPQEPV